MIIYNVESDLKDNAILVAVITQKLYENDEFQKEKSWNLHRDLTIRKDVI